MYICMYTCAAEQPGTQRKRTWNLRRGTMKEKP